MLTISTIAWNLLQSDQGRLAYAASDSPSALTADPLEATAILASLDEYTPLIQESAVDLTVQPSAMSDPGFVLASQSTERFVTEPTKLEDVHEVVSGDTITGIAQKYGLHVATIADRNELSIDELESLTPGTALIIPPADTSDSKEWLVKLNEKKEAERQKAIAAANAAAAAKKRASSASTTNRSRSSSGFDGVAGMNFVVPIVHNGISRGTSSYHFGIDYRASTGTAVKAAQDGKVIETTGGWAGGFGNSILVDHGGGVTTRYAHLSQIGVSSGDIVSRGEVIGRSGNTGYSTGPHLHFETRVNGRAVNPF